MGTFLLKGNLRTNYSCNKLIPNYCTIQNGCLFFALNKPQKMKKTIIAAIVGGLLIFIWQTLSWTVLDLHRPSQDYTPKQDTIMSVLNATLDKEGGYLLPNVPKGTSMEDAEKFANSMQGKPWASIQYHNGYKFTNSLMIMNMARGLAVDIIMVLMLCWILMKIKIPSFSTILISCLMVGLIIFIDIPYTGNIWYKSFDLNAHLIDVLASWGLCGLWLGWWLRR